MSKETMSTPPKNYIKKIYVVILHFSLDDNMNIDILSDQMDVNLLETSKVNNSTSTTSTSSNSKKATTSGKLSISKVDPL